jgi:hypothetical protein
VGVPFVAAYLKGTERLVFVGAHHAFHPNDPTMRAVTTGFAKIQPIVEGFPTAMGENPPPLVEEAHRFGRATRAVDQSSALNPMWEEWRSCWMFRWRRPE